ncbi:vanadium-dependent haloperoxidase [Massilia sp. CF038]|uniref:vanadium-dependent haloperoxidase n=1 Tax=Massilia sp. CF038 TaxID=1881045 RepID=UPI0009323DCA|nr:vanadium-dependent haloperoxidase [Massilia sp. CF038]
MERRNFIKLGSGAALGAALTACGGSGGHYRPRPGPNPPPPPTPPTPPEPTRSKVAFGWNTVALAALTAARNSAPLAARTLAILHTAMYNAWAAYDAIALSTRHAAQLRRPAQERTAANQLRAVSYAAYAVLLDQFPTQRAAFDAHMALLAYNPARASLDPLTPEGIGGLTARVLLDYAYTDGSNQLGTLTPGGVPFADYSGYAARNPALLVTHATERAYIPDPGHWQPLTYLDAGGVLRTQTFLLPFWGQVRPFALTSGAQFRPAPPAQFGTSAFTDQARDIVNIQAALTEEQKVMVDFWRSGISGETPAATWSHFAAFVSTRDHLNEDGDIKLLFALTNAQSDAAIAAWDAKRSYDSARPLSAVRWVLCGQRIRAYGLGGPLAGLNQILGQEWMPYQPLSNPTLPFPDYVSGHSTLSAAAAEVLKRYTGSDAFNHSLVIPAASSSIEPTVPTGTVTLAWPSFTLAACEAGTSRVYGGIHFHDADVAGRALGEQVGGAAFALAERYWKGQA